MHALTARRPIGLSIGLLLTVTASLRAQGYSDPPAGEPYRPGHAYRPVQSGPASYEPQAFGPSYDSAPGSAAPAYRDPYLRFVQDQRGGDTGGAIDEGEPGRVEVPEGDKKETDDALEARLAKLEDLFAEQDKKAIPKPLSWKPTVDVGGRIHIDAWQFPEDSPGIGWFENPDTGVDPENRFLFRRVRLELEGDLSPVMVWRFQIEFAELDTPALRDVYIGFTDLPVLQTLLIGHQKRPLGLDHLNSSRFNVFLERPLVVEPHNEDARRLGIQSYGVSDDLVYNWRYGVFLIEDIDEIGSYTGDSAQASLNGRFAASPWYDEVSGGRGYLHLAAATMLARPDGDVDPDDTNNNEARFRTRSEVRSVNQWLDTGRIPLADWYNINALEFMLNVGELHIVSEVMANNVYRDGAEDLLLHGGYVSATYTLTGEHIPLDRETGTIGRLVPYENFFLVERCCGRVGGGWGAWQVAARYSYLDLTNEDVRGGLGNDATLGMNWWWTPHARLQFNAVYGDIRDRRPVEGFTGGHFLGLGTRVSMDF